MAPRTQSPSRTRATLQLQALEDREVPAAFSFSGGLLTVEMSEVAGRSFGLDANSGGVLVINGRTTGGPHSSVVGAPGGRLMASQVTAIRVNGSAFDDVIDLTRVSSRAFVDLNGRVVINGGGGRDTIRGSEFGDHILGGGGDDRIFGGLGNDRIEGGDGHDYLYGDGNSGGSDRDGGNDRIDGGAGNDHLYGGGGSDLVIGGLGADSFLDTGVAGLDVFWVDGSDLEPRRGWGWAGAESARTGTPPRV